jgi:hypothetical protein
MGTGSIDGVFVGGAAVSSDTGAVLQIQIKIRMVYGSVHELIGLLICNKGLRTIDFWKD